MYVAQFTRNGFVLSRLKPYENWERFEAGACIANSPSRLKFSGWALGTKLPSIGAVPSGNISLEWLHSRRRSLTVTVSPDGDLHYAALLGPGRICGKEPFFDEAPQIILDLIARIYQC